MTRNLKLFGPALVAVFAMGALAVAAQASVTVTPAEYPAYITGTPIGSMKYETNTGQKVECTGAGGHSTIKAKGTGDTVVTTTNVSASGCTAKIGESTLPATVNATGCDGVIHGGTEDKANHFIHGEGDLVCPEGVTGPDITIYASAANHAAGTALCTLRVSAFVNHGEGTAENVAGSPNTVLVKAINVVSPVKREGSILCGNPETSISNGEGILKAYKDEGVGPPIKEGAQIGLTVSKGA